MPALPAFSPPQGTQNLDPNLMQFHMGQQPANQYGPRMPTAKGGGIGSSPVQGAGLLNPTMQYAGQQPQGSSMWHGGGFDAGMPDGQSPSDSWSTGSAQGQPVPATLNVEDWLVFFIS